MPSCKAASPLQRGTACLCCRKRKLKCDGTRPVCRQCVKMNRSDDCEYDDKKQKSRTQKLREKLTLLEERIRELESDPCSSSTSASPSSTIPLLSTNDATLDRPASPLDLSSLVHLDSLTSSPEISFQSTSSNWGHVSSSSSSSSSGSMYGSFYSPTGAISLHDEYDSDPPANSYFEMPPFDLSDPMFQYLPRWNPNDELPRETHKILLDIFITHRHQCWFNSSMERFNLNSKAPSSGTEPHPALMNSIYLLSCHFGHAPPYNELEPIFFARALREITLALDSSDRLVDIVQASCLLAVYLYANCRALEAYCHSFSAARLAVGLGLHQITLPDRPDFAQYNDSESIHGHSNAPTPIPILPPRDLTELGDRITAFWQVFMVDRCWSVANGLPLALPDGDASQVQIKTPWPRTYNGPDYVAHAFSQSTLRSLFEQPLDVEGQCIYMPALKVKAAALYERTYRLASVSNTNSSYLVDHQAAKMALLQLNLSLPSFVGFETWRNQAPSIDVDLFTIHTMVYVSRIHLQTDAFEKDTFQAANSIMSLVRQLNDRDYEFLDPILSACWMCVARMYIRVLGVAGQSCAAEHPSSRAVDAVEVELDVLLAAMRTLGAFFPLAGEHAQKVEQERVQMRTKLATAGC